MHDSKHNAATPVDLSYLREITDGEKALERELFALFFTNTDHYLKGLSAHCIDGEDQDWRVLSHEMKGACASIGACKLADFCNTAQLQFEASATEKKAILGDITAELQVVKRFLSSLY